MYVRDKAALEALVEQVRGAPVLAIDTEFVREHQYYPQLEIIQVATREVQAIVDFRALGALGPFVEILNDLHTLKLFHAGTQDLEIFFNLTGTVPAPLFDTQVAAAMLGLGAQVGYARLVEMLLGVSLAKSETLTDWSRRPLSDAQIQYALDDVRYLLPVYDILQARLVEADRSDWLDAEWEAMTYPDAYRRVAPREAYRRVSGSNRMKPRDLAVLRELAAWREETAVRRNRAASLIVRDNILLELVKRAPESLRQLAEIRGLHERERERHGEEMLDAIRRGKALPRKEWPRPPQHLSLTEQESSLVSMMQSWLRARADEVGIAPNYLATAADLKELVASPPEEREQLAVLRGWRRRLVGGDLLALVEGRAHLIWEPDEQRLRLVYPEGAT
jgi:ribonuclease D